MENPLTATWEDPITEKLRKLNMLDVFPDEVRGAVANTRIVYGNLLKSFQAAVLSNQHFNQVFKVHINDKYFQDIIEENAVRLSVLDVNKRVTAILFVEHLFGSLSHLPLETTTQATTDMKLKKKKFTKKKKKGGKRGKRGGGGAKKHGKVNASLGVDDEYFPDEDFPPEMGELDFGDNMHHMTSVVQNLRNVCSAIIALFELDFYKSRDSLFQGLADMIGKIAEPIGYQDGATDKMSALVELIQSVTEPSRDYSAYGGEKKQCVRVRAKLMREAADEDKLTEDEDMEELLLLEEILVDDDETKACTCAFHGPCPCCCTGCYPVRHKELIEANDGVHVTIVKKGLPTSYVGDTVECHDGDEGVKITEISDEKEGNHPVEHVDDSFEGKESEEEIRANFNDIDTCSHCCCTCSEDGLNDYPDLKDYERCAVMFLEELKRFSPANIKFLMNLVGMISEEEASILSKQKLVELALPYCLKLLKELKVDKSLYIVEMVFKMSMSMTVARKYCYRDPEFFQALSNLLLVQDPCKNLDKNQLRADGAHVLYVSLMGSGRENFVKVSKTNAFQNMVDILSLDPKNEKDAQSAEDCFQCFHLFTDEWDLFIDDFQNTPMNDLIDRWRRYALEYTRYLPNFVWLLEMFKKRLIVVFAAHRRGRTKFRLASTFDETNLLPHTRIGCSNPKCYRVNCIEITGHKYKKCARCHLAYYCSKECQLAHRKTHKKYCQTPEWEIKTETVTTECKKRSKTCLLETDANTISKMDNRLPSEIDDHNGVLQQAGKVC